LEGFYRFFERYQRITGESFFALQAPAARAPFEPKGTHTEFLAEVARQRAAFLEHMDDDFNTGGAVGVLYELLTALNRFADARQLEGGKASPDAVSDFRRGVVVLKELSQILGVFREPQGKIHKIKVSDSIGVKGDATVKLLSDVIEVLINLRAEARKAKNFALGDQIRKRLGELGITLEDRPGGTEWRLG
jgi:cysteinyl-tRNA synthetase